MSYHPLFYCIINIFRHLQYAFYLHSKLDTPTCVILHEHFLRGIASVLLEYDTRNMVK